MKPNVGRTDRTFRIVGGVVLLVLGIVIVPAGWLAWVFNIIGVLLVVTGILAFCPLYTLLKINTFGK
jgi:Inner membrane protein YgaP-like, transmembrane domain